MCDCPIPMGSVPLDSGRIDIDRLNNYEYDNTMMDLLGVNGMAQATFQPDEQCDFDNCADAFTMNDSRYKQYFDNADMIGEEVFADTSPTGLLQKYIYGLVSPACTPSATDTTCSSRIIVPPSARRRGAAPLTTDEVQGLQTLATNAITLGETADGLDQAGRQDAARLAAVPLPHRVRPESGVDGGARHLSYAMA